MSTLVTPPDVPQAQRMLEEPTAQSGQFDSLSVPFGWDDSDRYDVVYGGLDHRELALVVLCQEADD